MEWEQHATSRRCEYIRLQTDSVRRLTVRGLEPEVERLMQEHRSDMNEQQASRGMTRNLLCSKLKAKTLGRKETLRAVLEEKNSQAKLNEKLRLGRSMMDLEGAAKCLYFSAVRDRSSSTKKEQKELRKQRQQHAKKRQVQHAELLDNISEQSAANLAQFTQKRNIAHQLLGFGCNVVADVRYIDFARWSSMAHLHLRVKKSVTDTTSDLACRRDVIIDDAILRLQRWALAWESSEIHDANAHCSTFKVAHVATIGTLLAQHATWVNNYPTVLDGIQPISQKKLALQNVQVAIHGHWHDVMVATVEACEQTKWHGCSLETIRQRRENVYTVMLDYMNEARNASTVACDAIIWDIRRQLDDHYLVQSTQGNVQQKALLVRDNRTKCRLCTETHDRTRIEAELEREQVRLSHLGKLLSSYTLS